MLNSLSKMDDTSLILTLLNADAGGRHLTVMMRNFVAGNTNSRAYSSLEQLRYLSCLSICDGVIRNSSKGLLEAPTLKKSAVNIDDRQRGRPKAASKIDCHLDHQGIKATIKQLFAPAFQASLVRVRNPYGDDGINERILSLIKRQQLGRLKHKSFDDLTILSSASGEGR